MRSLDIHIGCHLPVGHLQSEDDTGLKQRWRDELCWRDATYVDNYKSPKQYILNNINIIKIHFRGIFFNLHNAKINHRRESDNGFNVESTFF